MSKKLRTVIPSDLAAKVLFFSDRTCCVCRIKSKPVQIHHIDENPSNNVFENLSVLCFDCHNDTMIKGGFGRKLNSDQDILYRDDWLEIVQNDRRRTGMQTISLKEGKNDPRFIEHITSLAEIYRETEQYLLLIGLYDSLGNFHLRDKYIEIQLSKDSSDSSIIFYRGKQGKPELIPEEVIQREHQKYTVRKNFTERARFHLNIGKPEEAVKDYVRGINKAIDQGNNFTAAFYLKELFKNNIIDSLFEVALSEATEDNDLWWQVRALQELGWEEELNNLLKRNEDFIEESGDSMLNLLLTKAKGDPDEYYKARLRFATEKNRNKGSKIMEKEEVGS